MSILRTGGSWSEQAGEKMVFGEEIPVKCPQCQAIIIIPGFPENVAARCEKCGYPMIHHSDMVLVANECRKAKTYTQALNALQILNWLVNVIPEAGTALGELSNRYSLPVSELEKWNALVDAWSRGDEQAEDGLYKMCMANPDVYVRGTCEKCGAPRYYRRHQTGEAGCIYCQFADWGVN